MTGSEDCTLGLRLLLERKSHVDARDKEALTPLHYAARRGQIHAVRILLEAGADRSLTSQQGVTPLALARVAIERKEKVVVGGKASAKTPWGEEALFIPLPLQVEERDTTEAIAMQGLWAECIHLLENGEHESPL